MTHSAERDGPEAVIAPFVPAEPRARHDGWTPARQLDFIEALAGSGCVTEACAAVGVSRSAAYALRTRPDAQQFRIAWDAALDLAIRRLADACFSRALAGEAVPHFYKGAQVGEHRRYDNKLAMFLLRYRDPLRYAATLDQMVYQGHPETAAVAFARACNRLLDEAHAVPPAESAPDPALPAGCGPAAGEPPFATEPVGVAGARAAEEALIASDRDVGGSYERRERIHRLRGARLDRLAQAEEERVADAEKERVATRNALFTLSTSEPPAPGDPPDPPDPRDPRDPPARSDPPDPRAPPARSEPPAPGKIPRWTGVRLP